MLIQFTVGNFLSFKEKTTFSMVASPDEPGHEDRVVKINDDLSVLRIAAIYGANASGKSNVLQAIYFAIRLIIQGKKSGERISTEPFLLDSETRSKPSFFEFIFYWNAKIFRYGFTCNNTSVFSEWLQDESKDINIFKRELIKDKNEFSFGEAISNIFEREPQSRFDSISKERLNFIGEGTRENQLFLTEAVERNINSLVILKMWFEHRLMVIFPDSKIDIISLSHLDENEDRISDLNTFLSHADTGIKSLSLRRDPAKDLKIPLELSVQMLGQDGMIAFTNDQGERTLLEFKEGNYRKVSLEATHGSEEISFPWKLESQGTQRITELWQMILQQKDISPISIVDEIERSLHPELSRYFIEYWINSSREKSQLIFTTHNDNLLEDDLLRRDEVWMVTKNKEGASELASLVEYKIPPGTNVQKAYLHGWFNGVPRLGAKNFYHTIREEAPSADSAA